MYKHGEKLLYFCQKHGYTYPNIPEKKEKAQKSLQDKLILFEAICSSNLSISIFEDPFFRAINHRFISNIKTLSISFFRNKISIDFPVAKSFLIKKLSKSRFFSLSFDVWSANDKLVIGKKVKIIDDFLNILVNTLNGAYEANDRGGRVHILGGHRFDSY